MAFEDDYFIQEVSWSAPASVSSPPAETTTTPGSLGDAVRLRLRDPARLVRLVETNERLEFDSEYPLSPSFAALDPNPLVDLVAADEDIVVYRNMFGDLSYVTAPSRWAMPGDGDGHGGGSYPHDGDRPIIFLRISSPLPGSVLNGLSGGVDVIVTGSAEATKVEVKIDGGQYALAIPKTPNDFSTWSHTLTITQPGPVTVTAKATFESLTRTESVSFSVVLTPAANFPADVSPPILTIDTPTADAVITSA